MEGKGKKEISWEKEKEIESKRDKGEIYTPVILWLSRITINNQFLSPRWFCAQIEAYTIIFGQGLVHPENLRDSNGVHDGPDVRMGLAMRASIMIERQKNYKQKRIQRT